jgi:hypothetical protein
MKLTAAELERGWAEFHCPSHGFLVATTPLAGVSCECGKTAFAARNGRRMSRTSLHRLRRYTTSLQMGT